MGAITEPCAWKGCCPSSYRGQPPCWAAAWPPRQSALCAAHQGAQLSTSCPLTRRDQHTDALGRVPGLCLPVAPCISQEQAGPSGWGAAHRPAEPTRAVTCWSPQHPRVGVTSNTPQFQCNTSKCRRPTLPAHLHILQGGRAAQPPSAPSLHLQATPRRPTRPR